MSDAKKPGSKKKSSARGLGRGLSSLMADISIPDETETKTEMKVETAPPKATEIKTPLETKSAAPEPRIEALLVML